MVDNITLINYLRPTLGKLVDAFEIDSESSKKDRTLRILARKENVDTIARFLRKHSLARCKQLMDLSAVDYPDSKNRFSLMYNLLSVDYNFRVLIKCSTAVNEPVESMTIGYSSAIWLEREVWDLFGIFFYNHPDQRRILTDYGFQGFPLRKDFPLTGFLEVRYDDEKKQIVQEPVELSQELRVFDFLSPWRH